MTTDGHDPTGTRLQKVLAAAGVGSRRACERLISAGRVEVDGAIINELGTRIDAATAIIHVDGLRIQLDDSRLVIALNKPVGVMSTMSDEQGRPDLGAYVGDYSQRLFHIGRLDAETEGLLLLTNDGELGNRLSHPSYEVPKTYVARVQGSAARGLPRRLRAGVELADGPVRADEVSILETSAGESLIEIVLHEGRNHIVRRLLAEVGHPVQRLIRTRFGTVRLGSLAPGQTRAIQGNDLGRLMSEVGL